MKLVFCVGQLNRPGGTEKVMANKVNYFVDKLEYEVHIITINQKKKDLFYHYDKRIIFHNIPYKPNQSKFLNPIKIFKNIQFFKKAYKNLFELIKPDIITVNERGYLDYVIPSIRKDIPKIREFHSSKRAIRIHASQMKPWYKKLKHLLMYRTIYYMFNKYDSLILLTENDKKESTYRTNVAVIPNMHKPEMDKISQLNKKNVISVGSMSGKIKRFDLQIDLWKDLIKEHPNWVLNIYGEGSRKAYLQDKINKLGLQKNVLLHGASNNLSKHYLDASIYLFTSIGEGFGMVLIEAMSYGVPCVSFNCPHGPSEIINNNVDGFLIENDNFDELKNKLTLLMKDENLRQKFGENAFINSKRFLPENIAPKWDKLYKKILIKNGSN